MKGKVLAVALGVSMVVSAAGTSPAFAISKGDKLQSQIESLHNKQDKKRQETKEKQEVLQQVQEKKEQTIQEAKQLSSQIDSTEGKIDTKQSSVSETKDQIDKLKDEIKETKKRIEKRDKVLKKRVRTMYESGGTVNYVSVLLGSQNFSDLLDRVMALSMITEQDKELLEAQKNDKQSLERDKQKVQKQLAKLEDQLDELKELKAQLDVKKQRKNELANQLKAKEGKVHGEVMDAKEIQENLAAQKAATEKLLSNWKAEQKRIAAEKKRQAEAKAKAEAKARAEAKAQARAQAEAQKAPAKKGEEEPTSPPSHASTLSTHGSGILSWPASGRISSYFGHRDFRGSEFHPGIDIAASGAVPIHAAASGVVFNSYRSSSYGNCVMITHLIDGQQYTTVYAHMRSRSVSTGQSVSQGQQIGVMGSTGDSTGQHLHFEVYKGGWTPSPHYGALNPLSFLPSR